MTQAACCLMIWVKHACFTSCDLYSSILVVWSAALPVHVRKQVVVCFQDRLQTQFMGLPSTELRIIESVYVFAEH